MNKLKEVNEMAAAVINEIKKNPDDQLILEMLVYKLANDAYSVGVQDGKKETAEDVLKRAAQDAQE